jgi:hypothetical protein
MLANSGVAKTDGIEPKLYHHEVTADRISEPSYAGTMLWFMRNKLRGS